LNISSNKIELKVTRNFRIEIFLLSQTNINAAVSSNWWYSKIPDIHRIKEYEKTRQYFIKRQTNIVTDDVIIAYGEKQMPGNNN